MTDSPDITTNYSPSDFDNDDYPIDLFVEPIHQQEHINDDEFGLFNNDDDDDDEDNLTLFDLKSIHKSDHDLSIFDELEHQCNAVLLETNHQQKSVLLTNNTNIYSSNFIKTTTMINDYERRFQRSLQKLNVPSWYNDIVPSPKLSTKPVIISTSHYNQESHRTPEIVHVHRPHSYRSCRSSLGTSPSPSVHSWHPNNMIDGMNFSPLLPSSSYNSRRSNKYEKGIERVTKSSRWYQPTQFVAKKKSDQIRTSKVSTIAQEKRNYNHYDIPKFHDDNLENSFKQSLNPVKSQLPRLSIQRQANCLIDDIDFDDVENTSNTGLNNNHCKGNILVTYDKQQDSHIESNEIPLMSLANEKISFGRVELEEVTDEDENDKRSSTNNIYVSSTVEQHDDETNTLLERLASNLVDSVLNDILLSKDLNHHDTDDTNIGVRELSDDENGLRELDENDMSGTDEFILFATKAEVSDDDDDDDNNNNNNDNNEEEKKNNQNDNPMSPTAANRGSLNRLYTFSRTNDDGTMNNSKKLFSNQDSSTSGLMIVDKDISIDNSHLNIDANQIFDLDNDDSKNPLPIYRSHIQKRHINLGRYYDGMMRATTSQLPTHDLRCNLILNEHKPSDGGVTEETVRKGRILLNQIPNPIEIKNQLNEPVSNTPLRSILKNTRLTSLNEPENTKIDEQILKIEENEDVSSRKIITTITEEYHRIHRKIIEELEREYHDSDFLNNHDQINNTQQSLISSISRNNQSPYELLSECYSGYSFARNRYSLPTKSPFISNVSSLQTTTDEAYDSETTASPRSPTVSSSTAVTISTSTHVHPELVYEFEYPSPPPPVPDRRLKPAHLRPPPPPTKPRSHKQQNDPAIYSKIHKQNKTSPLTAIQHLISTTSNDLNSSSTRTLSSRHYCGSLPVSSEPITSSSASMNTSTKIRTDVNLKSNSKIRSLSTNDNQQIIFKKPSSSSLNKNKSKKTSSAYFDETTNGLAIRLPATQSNEQNSINKQNLTSSKTSTPSSTKRIDETIKQRPRSENLNSDRSSTYETSV